MWRKPFEAGDIVVVVVVLLRALENAKRREPAVARQQRASKRFCSAQGTKVLIDEHAAAFALRDNAV